MRQIKAETEIVAGVDVTWTVVGDVGSIADWMPGLSSSRLDGEVRHITFENGDTGTERILLRDDSKRYYTFEFEDDLVRIESTLAIHGTEQSARVLWSATVDAKTSEKESNIATDITNLYNSALRQLKDQVEQLDRSSH